jgi:hypothetical protein
MPLSSVVRNLYSDQVLVVLEECREIERARERGKDAGGFEGGTSMVFFIGCYLFFLQHSCPSPEPSQRNDYRLPILTALTGFKRSKSADYDSNSKTYTPNEDYRICRCHKCHYGWYSPHWIPAPQSSI